MMTCVSDRSGMASSGVFFMAQVPQAMAADTKRMTTNLFLALYSIIFEITGDARPFCLFALFCQIPPAPLYERGDSFFHPPFKKGERGGFPCTLYPDFSAYVPRLPWA